MDSNTFRIKFVYLNIHLYHYSFLMISHIFAFCLQEMLDEADRDRDGEINEEEFLRMMKKTTLY